MILYDWKKVYTEANKSPSTLLNLIAFITYPRIPDNIYDHPSYEWSTKDWSGLSFLVNPESLLGRRKSYADLELAQYVAIASFRNYAEYLATGRKTLPLEMSPVDKDFVKTNRLLTISEDVIYFCWEETSH